MKRNLKNINHWIAELRDLAIKNKFPNGKTGIPLTLKQVKIIFCKENWSESFYAGCSPKESIDLELKELEKCPDTFRVF
jgi:hypothetical protein